MGRMKAVTRKIGLRAAIFLAYLFVGAGVFLAIESTDDSYTKAKKNYENERLNLMKKYNISDLDMKNFTDATRKAVKIGLFKNEQKIKWNFVNAFFFCGNVVTTIGYGHIVPRTLAGKLVCILYALVGIPLTGFFLRTVGNELTNFLAFSIKYWERRLYNREAEKIEMKSAITASLLVVFMLCLGGLIFALTESWNYSDSFYYCFISLTTIGFGDLIPGLTRDQSYDNVGVSLTAELAALMYYVIGLSVMSGVILSLSNLIEEKTKKFDLQDPMDAIRNLRIENLNTKAMKKLGYKVTNGPLDEMTHYNLNARRGTIVPDDVAPPRRVSKMFDDASKLRTGGNPNLEIPPMLPNGTVTRKVKPAEDADNDVEMGQAIEEERSTKEANKEEDTTEVDTVVRTGSATSEQNGLAVNNSVIVDVDVSPAPSRRPSSNRPMSANSLGTRRLSKPKVNKILPSKSDSNSNEKRCSAGKKTDSASKEPPDRPTLKRRTTENEIKKQQITYRRNNEIGLPSEIFAATINQNKRKVLERTASESHTDEIEYNEIMEEILAEQLNSKIKFQQVIKNKNARSPTPEFLSLTKQLSEDSDSHVERNNHFDDSSA